jgi:hypothetical protein
VKFQTFGITGAKTQSGTNFFAEKNLSDLNFLDIDAQMPNAAIFKNGKNDSTLRLFS